MAHTDLPPGESPDRRLCSFARGDIPRVCQRAWTTVADSAAVRRTHIWQRRYQSRSDDWLYRSLRRYVLRGGEKGRTRARGRQRDGEERVATRVANEERETRGRRGVDSRSLAPGHGAFRRAERLLRGGIIHQAALFFLSPSLPSSVSLSLSLPLCLSLTLRSTPVFGPHPAHAPEKRRWEARRKASRGASCETRAISHGAFIIIDAEDTTERMSAISVRGRRAGMD